VKVTIEDADEMTLTEMVQAKGMKRVIEEAFVELRKIWKYSDDKIKAGYAEEMRDFLVQELRENNVTCID